MEQRDEKSSDGLATGGGAACQHRAYLLGVGGQKHWGRRRQFSSEAQVLFVNIGIVVSSRCGLYSYRKNYSLSGN